MRKRIFFICLQRVLMASRPHRRSVALNAGACEGHVCQTSPTPFWSRQTLSIQAGRGNKKKKQSIPRTPAQTSRPNTGRSQSRRFSIILGRALRESNLIRDVGRQPHRRTNRGAAECDVRVPGLFSSTAPLHQGTATHTGALAHLPACH